MKSTAGTRKFQGMELKTPLGSGTPLGQIDDPTLFDRLVFNDLRLNSQLSPTDPFRQNHRIMSQFSPKRRLSDPLLFSELPNQLFSSNRS